MVVSTMAVLLLMLISLMDYNVNSMVLVGTFAFKNELMYLRAFMKSHTHDVIFFSNFITCLPGTNRQKFFPFSKKKRAVYL